MNKKILLTLAILIIISFSYLAFTEERQANLDFKKNWWSIYFVDPKEKNLNFIIENHSSKNKFNWKIESDGEKIKENEIILESGKKKIINLEKIDFTGQKIKISISSGKTTKSIYKQF